MNDYVIVNRNLSEDRFSGSSRPERGTQAIVPAHTRRVVAAALAVDDSSPVAPTRPAMQMAIGVRASAVRR